jgi:hypothetical protein
MESTLLFPQAEEQPSDPVLLQQQCQIRLSEEGFRALLGRATTVAIFLIASSVVFNLLPFYPPPMSIFLALVLGGIAYRWPSVALGLMLFFAAPAYSYQLGGVMWALGAMVALAVVLPFCVSGLSGAIIGCVAGATAGVLMLTPYFLLALPVLAVAMLPRFKGSSISGLWAVFLFLTFYLPFLLLPQTALSTGEAVPLFATVDFARQPQLDQLSLSSLKAAFQNAGAIGASGFPGVSAYFVQGWGGIALILTLLMALLATPALLNLSRRMGEGRVLFRGFMPLLSLLAIELVFLLPLRLLGEPLGYRTGLDDWGSIAILTGLMLGAGGIGFGVETWLHRRDSKVKLASDLTQISFEIRDLLQDAQEYISQIASVCHGKDLEDEKATIAQCDEKVALMLESLSALSLPRLEITWSEFTDMRSQLSSLRSQLEVRLLNYLDDSRRCFKTTVEGARSLGMPVAQELLNPMAASTDVRQYDQAIAEQARLNLAFKELAGELVLAGEMLADTVKEEIDPEFSLTTIDIGRGFLEQGRYEEAARTILEDLQIIDGRIVSPIEELAGKIAGMSGAFGDLLVHRLIPVFESTGDSEWVERCHEALAELDSIAGSVDGSRTLADLIGIVEQSRRLADLATLMVRNLKYKTSSLEADNDQRSPSRYNWGRNSHAMGDVQQLIESIESTYSRLTISSRFSVIESALQAIEQQAKLVKRYSQANEFLINYPNVEYVIDERLKDSAAIGKGDLPVNPKYALEYLKVYAVNNYDDVAFDPRSGTLRQKVGKKPAHGEAGK